MRLSKFIITAAAALLTAAAASAAPAFPRPVNYIQPDGSVITVQLSGDEHCHVYYTTDNRMLTREADGLLRPATPAEETAQLTELEAVRTNQFRGPGLGSAYYPHTGAVKTCVILVEFNDIKFLSSNAQQQFSNMFNQAGYSVNGAKGSVKEYFTWQSSGKFTPQFDVYGPVTLDYAHSKYTDSNNNVYKLVKDAISKLDSQVDFAQYDTNNDGNLDAVCIVFAGQGANFGGANAIWPHNKTLSSIQSGLFTKYDGKKLVRYMISSERGYDANAMDGMGTFVHEFSHTLGLADHYNTNTHNDYTPGYWDVMDWGCYLNNSHTPCNYSAYQRMALDWAQPVATLDAEAASVTLCGMDEQNWFVKLETGRSNDYYLLENRTHSRFDSSLYGEGMLIWHIDAGYSSLSSYPNNDVNHLAVELMRADNDHSTGTAYGIGNDAFPGGTNNNTFNGSSTPTMFHWSSSSSSQRVTIADRPITNITRNTDRNSITFNYKGGSTENVITPYATITTFHYDAVASPAEGGQVYIGNDRTATSADIEEGKIVTINAQPATGYNFKEWSFGGRSISTATTLYVGAASASNAGTYTATFTKTGGQGGGSSYCYPTGNIENPAATGITTGLRLDEKLFGMFTTITDLQSNSKPKLYCDKSDFVFTIPQGTELSITPQATVKGLHSYLFIDWNNNGFDDDEAAYYSNWSQDGTTWYTSNPDGFENPADKSFHNPATKFTVDIPEDAPLGKHRARYVCQWNSLDPCGSGGAGTDKAISKAGGIVADFTINIYEYTKPEPTYDVSVKALPADGGIAYLNDNRTLSSATLKTGETLSLHAEPAEGYMFNGWALPNGNTSTLTPPFYIYNFGEEHAGEYTANFEKIVGITGISADGTEQDEPVIYNIYGQRLREITQPGIYIVNGKKVIQL